jgi:hypothetical protein
VDTPDLGPVRKLGMGRRSGPLVVSPKAATMLPSFDGAEALAAELGAATTDSPGFAEQLATDAAEPVSAPAVGTNGSASASGDAQVAAAETRASGSSTEGEEEVIGGLEVDKTAMEGVAEDELIFLARRCKRLRKRVTS